MGHIHKLGLQNFRIFKSKEVLDFAPITILTGTNNSGKSTAIKCLQLLKASAANPSGLEKLLFTDGNHNLGSYENTTNNEIDSDEITITLSLPPNNAGLEADLELVYWKGGRNVDNGHLSAFRVVKKGKTIVEHRDDSRNQEPVEIRNGYTSYCVFADIELIEDHYRRHSTFKDTKIHQAESLVDESVGEEKGNGDFEQSVEALRKGSIVDNSVFVSFFKRKISSIQFERDAYENFEQESLQQVEEDEESDAIDRSLAHNLTRLNEGFGYSHESGPLTPGEVISASLEDRLFWEEPNYEGIESLPLSFFSYNIFNTFLKDVIPDCFAETASNLAAIHHLSSVRSSSERLYSNRSHAFEFNAILLDFLESGIENDEMIFPYIEKYLKEFKIGDGLDIRRMEGVASAVYLKQGDKQVLLADLGFGYTQLLPILLKIAIIAKLNGTWNPLFGYSYKQSVFLLEEPEGNLHPSYQSKIADMIIEAGEKFNIQFIIETHSEYLIRKLQYHTATGRLKPNDTAIYYFEAPDSKPKKKKRVRKINIQKDGRLSAAFGEGFFDETPRLMLSIMNLSDEN